MNKILKKIRLSSNSVSLTIGVPIVARKVRPGQFVIVRCDERSERVPFTMADWNAQAGTITLLIQEVGRSSRQLGSMNEGDFILDIVGPLGMPSHIEYFGRVICVGGGFGIAAIYPIARALKEEKNIVTSIIGAKTKALIIMEDELRLISDRVKITTEDGGYGIKGMVTEALREMFKSETADLIYAIGPVPMMKAVCNITKRHNIKTIVSLNPVMLDGTGMCGACRVNVSGKTKFTCIDGPDFDGHLIDFDCLMRRQNMYKRMENQNA